MFVITWETTGYCEVQADRMWHDRATNNCEWGQPYDFSRAAQCVMRLALLKAVGLERHCPSKDSTSMRNNSEALKVTSTDGDDNINKDGLLVNNQREAVRLFYSYFDSLFATHYIMAKLYSQEAGERNNDICRQMIVYNPEDRVLWYIIATLTITTDGRIVRRAVPYLAVIRRDPIEGRAIDDPPHPPDDDDESLEAVRGRFDNLKT